MPFIMFYELFPEMAKRETRSLTVLPGKRGEIPAGHYGFLDMYCDEPGCDCRRVFLMVLSSPVQRTEAVIAWGWEDESFYRKWSHDDDLPSEQLEALKGPCLNMGSPETELAPALLDFVRNVLLTDPAYVERIKRHYRMFREKIETPDKTEWRRNKKRLQ